MQKNRRTEVKAKLLRDLDKRKQRILEITEQIVTSQVARGEVDPEDDEALKKATYKAVRTAQAAYDAAMEYISG